MLFLKNCTGDFSFFSCPKKRVSNKKICSYSARANFVSKFLKNYMLNKFQVFSFKNDIFSDILYKFFGLNLQYKDYHFGTFCDELVHSFTKTVTPTATYCSIHHLEVNI